ncbi:hypothetical protein RJT34_31349 [Clitoria ternatea]|uniref:non-specific serine/threonine protein kinase n=1 Tax=Clitoria ternatea TaxID=43366 RepID=A0AAN9I2T6_CLITE
MHQGANVEEIVPTDRGHVAGNSIEKKHKDQRTNSRMKGYDWSRVENSLPYLYTALTSLTNSWQNKPLNWEGSDPCNGWDGIKCTNSRVTSIFLVDCGFSGPIPDEIGSLHELVFLSLNSNNLSGRIPGGIGNLSKLNWLDIADNELEGPLPISTGTRPGLDMLLTTKHLYHLMPYLSPSSQLSVVIIIICVLINLSFINNSHFGNNKLSGTIPAPLFSSQMALIHLLFENNQFEGNIPSSLGLVQKLELVRLDNNLLSGSVPLNINNLTQLSELYLANNKLSGPLPNLEGMNQLSYLMLKGNGINGTLDIGDTYSRQLQLIDLQNNDIENFKQQDMPVSASFCSIPNPNVPTTATTNNCEPATCFSDQVFSRHCKCSYPYTAALKFRTFSLKDWVNGTSLEEDLMRNFQHTNQPVDSVSLSSDNNCPSQCLELQIFPSGHDRFNRKEISSISSVLTNLMTTEAFYFFPDEYGHYYEEPVKSSKSSSNGGIIIGAAVGGSALLVLLLLAGGYAFWQKKRAEKAIQQNSPFGHVDPNDSNSSSIPRLKGIRRFSLEEIQKYTKKFSQDNDIGSGGFGKVYLGVLPNGQQVAIKRAKRESMQEALQFKSEIELLSRVHHKNLVSLVGFCFEKGEQILVYDYVPNGTLKDAILGVNINMPPYLSRGKSVIRLDWIGRLKIALDIARGLDYLHEHANPPIIHRDIKSSNILLDERLNAKVADFGLSKPMLDFEKDHVTTQVKGTMGYLDPEYYTSQELTEKSDVYSYGVLMLELITARKPIERGKYIVKVIRNEIDKSKDLYGLEKFVDPNIGEGGSTLKGFEMFVDLAMKCVEDSRGDRPTMNEVVKEIENLLLSTRFNCSVESTSSTYDELTQQFSPSQHHS